MSKRAESLVAALEKVPLDAAERRALLDGLGRAWFPQPVKTNAPQWAHRQWSADHDELLLKMLDQGASAKDIAAVLGRTSKAVAMRRARLRPEDCDPMRVLMGQINALTRAEKKAKMQ